MSNFELHLTAQAGTTIQSCIEEAKQLANKLDIGLVCFDFNGVELSISKSCSVDRAIQKYLKASRETNPEDKYVIE